MELKKKISVVKFFADWCGPCQMYGPEFIKAEEQNTNEDVEFISLSIDEHIDTAAKYEVMGVPTTVILVDGEEKSRFSGMKAASTVLEEINKII